MTKSQIFTAAHKMAKTFEGNYSACLSLALTQIYSDMKKKTTLVKALRIEYKNKKAQSTAKINGFKYNSNTKNWEHLVGVEMDDTFSIFEYRVEEKKQTKKLTYAYVYETYGFDVAEEGDWSKLK